MCQEYEILQFRALTLSIRHPNVTLKNVHLNGSLHYRKNDIHSSSKMKTLFFYTSSFMRARIYCTFSKSFFFFLSLTRVISFMLSAESVTRCTLDSFYLHIDIQTGCIYVIPSENRVFPLPPL